MLLKWFQNKNYSTIFVVSANMFLVSNFRNQKNAQNELETTFFVE